MAAKKTRAAKTPSKSDFIRQLPSSMSAAEVVERAKASGVKIDPALVYKVRGRAAATRKTKAVVTGKTAAAASHGPDKLPASKAAFVRAHAKLSPKQIVARAAAAGIELGVGYVYNVRASNKGAGRKNRVEARAVTARRAVAVPRPIATPSSAEILLKAVAAEVGLGRAIELLQSERARVHSFLRG